MRTILFDTGQTIFSEGDPSALTYRIIAGSVDIVILGWDGSERKLSSLGPEEIFGEMGIIDPGPRSATAIAREPTCCEIYTADEMFDLMADDPSRAMDVVRSLTLRLRGANRKLAARRPPGPPRRPW